MSINGSNTSEVNENHQDIPLISDISLQDLSGVNLFEQSGTANFLVDVSTSCFTHANCAFSAMTGYTEEELHQLTPFAITHSGDRRQYQHEWQQYLQNPNSHFEIEYRCTRKDGTIFYVNAIHTLIHCKIGNQPKLYGILRDITSHRQALEFLERALFEASDRERRRIGQELHDHLCQHLLGAAFAAKAIAGDLKREGSSTANQLDELAKIINEAVVQARNVARGLNPIELDSAGLMSALEELVDHVNHTVQCNFVCEKPIFVEDFNQARHAYQIAKEAVADAAQKPGVKQITVWLTEKNHDIILRISDDGYDKSELLSNPEGASAKILDYRIRAMNGQLTIEKPSRGGTILTCIFPTYHDNDN